MKGKEELDKLKEKYIENLKSQLYDLKKQRKINKVNYYLVNYTITGKDNCSL